MVATFNLFLWGVTKTGFQRASLPFEWWSYLTFGILLVSTAFGLGGYVSIKKGTMNAKTLIGLQTIFTTAGIIVHLANLLLTFAGYNTTLIQHPHHFWIYRSSETPHTVAVGLLQTFKVNYFQPYQLFELQFLSLGFWLALASAITSLFTFLKLRRPE